MSVQEKLSAAILNMTVCVSEPELSDSTTEEDELMSVMNQWVGPGSEPESNLVQQTAEEQNEAKPIPVSEEELTEKPKEKLKKDETPLLETKREEEKDSNQTEAKIHEDEHAQDDQNKNQIPEVIQDTLKEEKEEDNNFTSEENKSTEVPAMMEKPKDEEPPDGEVTESCEQEPEKVTTSENSVNAEETKATPVKEEDNMMEIIQNPEGISVNNEGLNDGKEVSAEKVRTLDEEFKYLMNYLEETQHDNTAGVEESNMEDTGLKLKDSENEVKDEDVAGDDEKSEERVKVSETNGEKDQGENVGGNKTDVIQGMEETKDQDCKVKEQENTEEGNEDEEKVNEKVTEDRTDQEEPSPTGEISEKNTEDDVGEREKEKEEDFAAEKEAEHTDEKRSGGEGKEIENEKHKEELKEQKIEIVEAEEKDMEGEKRSTDVGGADAELQKIAVEQEENKEEQKENAYSMDREALQATMDGTDVKLGEVKAENGVEIFTVHQEELENKKKPGPAEDETSEEETNEDMTEKEGLKAEQIDDYSEKKEKEQNEMQQETRQEDEEKEKQKDEMENFKPLISKNSNTAVTQDESKSDIKKSAEDPAVAEERNNTNVDLESRVEKQSRAGDGSHNQSSTEVKKDKSVDAAEETRSGEGTTSLSEEPQPLEKVMVFKREGIEAELIIAPQADHDQLVSNWVNIHQASNYFETFIDTLDEIKIVNSERIVNIEALEKGKMIENPKEPDGNEESSETRKDEQISPPENSEPEELQDMRVENINMKTEAVGSEGQSNLSSGNTLEKEETQRQMISEQTPEDQEDVTSNNVMNVSATPLMKIEIRQDS